MKKMMLFSLFLFKFSLVLIPSEQTIYAISNDKKVGAVIFVRFNELPRALQYSIADYVGLNSPQGDSDWSLLTPISKLL